MAGTFQFTGLVAGLDTKSIISQLMSVERRPIVALQTKKTGITNRIGAYRDLNAKLAALKTAVSKLKMESVLLAKKATPDTTGIVSVTAGSSAAIGSFKITVDKIATATKLSSVASIGQPIDLATPLASAGFALTPTTGTFSIKGTTLTIDASTTLSNGVDGPGDNTILAKINNAGIGVTASIVNDDLGRPNKLQLTSASSIQIGSTGDTSNFLTAAKLLASPGTTTRTSTGNLGQVDLFTPLNSARLATSLSSATGSFTINGVSFNYDATTDSLNDITSRINRNANVGVTAAYDPVADKVVLTSKTTGSLSISRADAPGNNFLAAIGVLSGAETPGSNAEFHIDTVAGGATQFSSTNTITGLIPGATISLLGASATQVGVTISQDTTQATSAVNDFISAFNSTVSQIRDLTKYEPDSKKAGLLLSDSTIFNMAGNLSSKLFGKVSGLTGQFSSVTDFGISTGAIGAATGQTNSLVLDQTKFTNALIADPGSVAQVFRGIDGGAVGVAGLIDGYMDDIGGSTGLLSNRINSGNDQIRQLDTSISRLEDRVSKKEDELVKKFALLEQTLARLQAQSAQLSAQLGSLSSVTSRQ